MISTNKTTEPLYGKTVYKMKIFNVQYRYSECMVSVHGFTYPFMGDIYFLILELYSLYLQTLRL